MAYQNNRLPANGEENTGEYLQLILPENFLITMKNTGSGNAVVFRRNVETGLLSKTGRGAKIKNVSTVQVRGSIDKFKGFVSRKSCQGNIVMNLDKVKLINFFTIVFLILKVKCFVFTSI